MMEKNAVLMSEGRYAEAEEILASLLESFDNTIVRNNLATAVLEQGEPRRCLEILAPCLDPDREEPAANPYTFALASRALAALGERDAALVRLQEAEEVFAAGLEEYKVRATELELYNWREYTAAMLKAAAALDEPRLMLELYDRWEGEHVALESIFLAATAAFNLKEFGRAARFWEKAAKKWPMARMFKRVTLLVEQGAIPYFALDYRLKEWREIDAMMRRAMGDADYFAEILGKETGIRLFLLALTFDPGMKEEFAGGFLEKVVAQGGAWGEELGQGLLKADGVATFLKMAALRGLVEKGVYAYGQPVPVMIDGEERQIRLEEVPVVGEGEEKTLKAMRRASQLKEEGRLEEAIELLRETCLGVGKNFYPPAAINLSSLLCEVGQPEEAEKYLRIVERINPENPVVLFNLAVVLVEQGLLQEGEKYLERVEEKVKDREILERAALLREELQQLNG